MNPRANETDLSSTLGDAGVVPVVTITQPSDAVPLAKALLAGGLTCIEITFRSDAAVAAIETIRTRVSGLTVGAGTVLTTAQADAAVAAGALFLVAPGFNPAVVDYALACHVPVLPGVCTPSEVEQALARDLRVVKFFPAGAMGGPSFLRALMGPYPMMRYVPTGGIAPDNLADYLALDCVAAVGGTWLARPELVAAGDWATITRIAAETSALIRRVRSDAASRAASGSAADANSRSGSSFGA